MILLIEGPRVLPLNVLVTNFQVIKIQENGDCLRLYKEEK